MLASEREKQKKNLLSNLKSLVRSPSPRPLFDVSFHFISISHPKKKISQKELKYVLSKLYPPWMSSNEIKNFKKSVEIVNFGNSSVYLKLNNFNKICLQIPYTN